MLNLLHGDCLELMKEIPDNSIDMVLTSPPYDNIRSYNGSLQWSFDIFTRVADEIFRVIKAGGVVVWVVGDATIKGNETGSSFKQALYFKNIGLNLADTMIYHKTSGYFPRHNHKKYPCSFEYMFIFSKGKIKTFNIIKDRPNKYYGHIATGSVRKKDGGVKPKHTSNKEIAEFGARPNVWGYDVGYMKSSSDKVAFEHPAVFPERLALDHISSWSNPGDTVLDPFAGSGTTGKMAVKSGRKCILIEKEKKYYDIMCERLQ